MLHSLLLAITLFCAATAWLLVRIWSLRDDLAQHRTEVAELRATLQHRAASLPGPAAATLDSEATDDHLREPLTHDPVLDDDPDPIDESSAQVRRMFRDPDFEAAWLARHHATRAAATRWYP
jgi:hypothetical protein